MTYLDDDYDLEFEVPSTRYSRSQRTTQHKMSQRDEDLEADEEIRKIREKARRANSDFLDECDSMRGRVKERDKATLKYIDDVLKQSAPTERHNRRQYAENYIKKRYRSEGACNCSSRCHPNMKEEHGLLSEAGDEKDIHVATTTTGSAKERMRKIEAHLDGILDYELPAADSFRSMRHLLTGINDKMAMHRLLLDRYSGLDLRDDRDSVSDHVDTKYQELVKRNPMLESSHRDSKLFSEKRYNANFDPAFVPGYVTGLGIVTNDKNSELRGRIRNLICRTKSSSVAHPTVSRSTSKKAIQLNFSDEE
ncbi:hypothetical protein Ciccas_004145 [Cichlidogyrus casuarinus]|uniref:Uncharacterized protein n=1 Tax=Cichlidogyrus casuarinus TaxID=1844966 RepID=A0ABD2QCG8_9PLAT